MKPQRELRSQRPSIPSPSELRQLARGHGVATSYVDMDKRRQHASAESLLGVLRTLGVPVERLGDVPDALREMRRTEAQQTLEPVHVVWRGQPARIPLQLPERIAGGALRWEWRLESGEVRGGESRLEALPGRRVRRVDGGRFSTRILQAPFRLPTGYHRLAIACGRDRWETEVFSAPKRCHQGATSRRDWGVFAPLYALHSERSWGAGDFGDLTDIVTQVGGLGGRFVGTLPLLPAFLGEPFEPSPYSPVSRLFWNEFFLDLTCVPELETSAAARRLIQSAAFQHRRRELCRSSTVDYATQMSMKRRVLEILSRSFFAGDSERRRAFEQYLGGHPHLADYARFRAAQERRAAAWNRWPERMRGGELRDADSRAEFRQYHLYVQWLAHEQMTRLSDHARDRGVQLYLDMPLGTHRDGYDAWRYQELFALEASGGAPPDPVFTQGQDWGFAPVHPRRSREQGHAYMRAYLRHHLRHARMLRFDHVMGLHRLYWVPRGLPASKGAYVHYPAEEYYAMLSIESHRHQACIIGENLGTVPVEVDRSLRRHGVAGMFVVQYEARPAPRSALRRIPAGVVASLNTHDMPPFAAFWEGLDIADRRALGLIPPAKLTGEYRLRERVRRSLAGLSGRGGRAGAGESAVAAVFRATVRHLGLSAARWMLLNLEDLWQETASQNTPGTSTERVNWRRKARFSLEQLRGNPVLQECFRELSLVRPTAGRPQRFAEGAVGVRLIDGARRRRQTG